MLSEHDEIIYVRRTNNLRRCLLENDTCRNVGVSQFRRAFMQNYGLKDSGEISWYLRQKCTFKFKEIEDSVELIMLEHFEAAILAPTLNMKVKQ